MMSTEGKPADVFIHGVPRKPRLHTVSCIYRKQTYGLAMCRIYIIYLCIAIFTAIS